MRRINENGPYHGMSIREAQRICKRLGGIDEPIRRTGERRMSHPALDRPCKYNCRKQVASRAVSLWLMKLWVLVYPDSHAE